MKIEHSKADQQKIRAEAALGKYGEAARLSAAFLQGSSVWHRLATNSSATSCKDASARRWRLGKEGIGLHNELKSVAFSGVDVAGPLLVIAHCNGDYDLDEDRISAALNLLAGVLKADLSEQLGDMYGLVNPFNLALLLPNTRVKQVFDLALIEKPPLSQTMMTNGGHRNIGVEFRVRDIVDALGEAAVVRKISQKVSRAIEKLIFVAGGDGYAAFRFAKAVQDCANDDAGIRSGTGFGAIPMDVRIVPGLASTKAIEDYDKIIPEAALSAIVADAWPNALLVPCTLGTEVALRNLDKKLNVFDLTKSIFAHIGDLAIVGAQNDHACLRRLNGSSTFENRNLLAFDFIDDLDFELGVKMSKLNITQKMYEAFGSRGGLQININLWYYMYELSGPRAQARLGPSMRHLHDVAASDLALLFLDSHT